MSSSKQSVSVERDEATILGVTSQGSIIINQVVSSSRHRTSSKRKCALSMIAMIVGVCTLLSLSIGHYYHNQYSVRILSHLDSHHFIQFQVEPRSNKIEIEKSVVKSDSGVASNSSITIINRNSIDEKGLIHERDVFESIIKHNQLIENQCSIIPHNQKHTVQKELEVVTDTPLLPERGVAIALRNWLQKYDADPSTRSDSATCYLPPAKSCNTTSYTLILMSHTLDRLEGFVPQLEMMIDTWPGLTEVILVWNSDRAILTSALTEKDSLNLKTQQFASQLLSWDVDPSHPLRIFFSLEHNLTNNLLNRYHPALQPVNEAVLYFDDDGPFWSKESMILVGFELWKRNSNVQVGNFPRNIRFLSERMKTAENIGLQANINGIVKDDESHSGEQSYSSFTPLCRNVTGDTVEYNYFVFPDFAAHMLLPSGTLLHRNFLCFIWHPAFEELRQYVINHTTHPDDMMVSHLVSHLVGKPSRTFPREVQPEGKKRRLSSDNHLGNTGPLTEDDEEELSIEYLVDQSHRYLLWKQKNWGKMREEAINSILGYFGSISPGTVGWCAGTKYMKNNSKGVPYVCQPEKPHVNLIPWLQAEGIGHAQC